MNKDYINRFLHSTVENVVGIPPKKGMLFGIELELEGRNVGLDMVPTRGWRRTQDGSLRGESVEYVLSAPVSVDLAKVRVKTLFDRFKTEGVVLNNSYRTSSHIHLNFSDKTMKDVLSFFVLFTMFEGVLEEYSGDGRKGNLFCLSSRHSEEVVRVLSQCFLNQYSFDQFKGDAFKYSACNLSTLYKFGSIEIRTLKGADSAEIVCSWLDILNDLYVYSLNAESPIQFIEALSEKGAEGFFSEVFSKGSRDALLNSVPPVFDFYSSLVEGARLCQVLCYDIGDAFKDKPKPFQVEGGPIERAPKFSAIRAGAGVQIFHPRHNCSWVCHKPDRLKQHQPFYHIDPLQDDTDIVYDASVSRFFDFASGHYCKYMAHPVFGDELAALGVDYIITKAVAEELQMVALGAVDEDEDEVDEDEGDF